MPEDLDDKTQVLSRSPVAAAPVAAPSALLNCVDTSVLKDGVGKQIELQKDDVSIGRDDENAVSLHAQGVSRYHARVFVENGRWTVEDLGSTNGTRVNNSKLESKQALEHGDTVAFGRACYKFQITQHDDVGAATGIDIDLGASEKTVIMRPGQKSAATAAGAQASGQVSGQAAAQPATAASAPPRPRPAAAKAHAGAPAAKSSNTGLWLIVVVAVLALVGGGAKLLGFI